MIRISSFEFRNCSGFQLRHFIRVHLLLQLDTFAPRSHSACSVDDLWTNIILLLSRYLHIVCVTLLVGGTLFYEMVVPVAIGDLKTEQQLSVFARARWVFRWIVWLSAGILLISGTVTTWISFLPRRPMTSVT